jgi:hypothetical protein
LVNDPGAELRGNLLMKMTDCEEFAGIDILLKQKIKKKSRELVF